MSVTLRNVLISDAVDSSCVELLQSHGINVTCKQKLPKDQLLQEIKVSPASTLRPLSAFVWCKNEMCKLSLRLTMLLEDIWDSCLHS